MPRTRSYVLATWYEAKQTVFFILKKDVSHDWVGELRNRRQSSKGQKEKNVVVVRTSSWRSKSDSKRQDNHRKSDQFDRKENSK